MNKPSELINEFNSFSDCYDEIVTEHLSYQSHEIVPAMMLPHISSDQPNILDLGCGTGISSTLFFDRHFSVTGIDISPGMIRQAENRPFERLICQSLEEPLPFHDGEFDAVIILGVMEFIEKPIQLFQQIRKVLKDGGLIGVTFPMNKPDAETQLTVASYTDDQIAQLIKEVGLEVVESKQFLGYDSPEYTIQYTGYVLRKM